MENSKQQSSYTSPPPPYSLHDPTLEEISITKKSKVADNDESNSSKGYMMNKKTFFLIPLAIFIILSIALILYLRASSNKLSSMHVIQELVPYIESLDETNKTYIMQMSDLTNAVPYSYVSVTNITPICMYDEENIFTSKCIIKLEDVEQECFCGVIPSSMTRTSLSPIDSTMTQCRTGSFSEYLPSKSLFMVFRNARFIRSTSGQEVPNLTSMIFYNTDSLLYSEIEDFVSFAGDRNLVSSYSSISKTSSSLFELAKTFFQKPSKWTPNITKPHDLSFQKDFIANSAFTTLSSSKGSNSVILRFRFIIELGSFFLSSSSTQSYNSSLIRLSQSFLKDLSALLKDEKEAISLIRKYGSHIFQSGTIGGSFDILLEIDLLSIRDPFLESYFSDLRFCLEYQFSELAKLMTSTQGPVNSSSFMNLSKKIASFLVENPKCFAICKQFQSTDLLFPSNIRSIELRSSHMDNWVNEKITSTFSSPSLSSGTLFEHLSKWSKNVQRIPRIIKGQMIPIHDILNIYVVPFQQQFYLWTCNQTHQSPPLYDEPDSLFSDFDELLLTQKLIFEKPISQVITEVESTISKLNSVLAASHKYEKIGHISGATFDNVPSFSAFISRNKVEKNKIAEKELQYLNDMVSILDVFVFISKPSANSSELLVSTTYRNARVSENTINWALYQDANQLPLQFADSHCNYKNSSLQIGGYQLLTSPLGFHLDTILKREFVFNENGDKINATIPLGMFPTFITYDQLKKDSVAKKDLGMFLPLDTSPHSNNTNNYCSKPVSASSIILSFAPIEIELFDYFSRYDNYTKGPFLDTYPPLYLSDLSIRVGSLQKLFSLKKASFDSIKEAQSSPFVSSVICTPCDSIDNLGVSSSYNSYKISKSKAAQQPKCFSLVLDLPKTCRILSIACQKITPRKTNSLIHTNIFPEYTNQFLFNIPYQCQLAYIKE